MNEGRRWARAVYDGMGEAGEAAHTKKGHSKGQRIQGWIIVDVEDLRDQIFGRFHWLRNVTESIVLRVVMRDSSIDRVDLDDAFGLGIVEVSHLICFFLLLLRARWHWHIIRVRALKAWPHSCGGHDGQQ